MKIKIENNNLSIIWNAIRTTELLCKNSFMFVVYLPIVYNKSIIAIETSLLPLQFTEYHENNLPTNFTKFTSVVIYVCYKLLPAVTIIP